MYFPLKKKEIQTKIESDSVTTLKNVVDGLKEELARKEEQIVELKEGQKDLMSRVVNLENKDTNNGIAFSSVSLCEYYNEHKICPILNKRKELINE